MEAAHAAQLDFREARFIGDGTESGGKARVCIGEGTWLDEHGKSYPNVRYLWRSEPDVAFSGSIDALLELSARDEADVLLPATRSREEQPHYPHWRSNDDLVQGLPKAVYALVPIGRYSVHFLRDVMRPKWEAGEAGYEEITLPSFCLADGGRADKGCRLHAFSRGRSVDGRHVIYKPDWGCLEFLAARTFRNGTNELWHPVKRLRCVAAALEAAARGGSAEEVRAAAVAADKQMEPPLYVNGSLADAGPTTAGDVALRAGLGSSRPPREIDVAQTKKWVTSLLLGRDEDAPAAKAAPAPSQEGILARMERVAGRQEGLSWRERLASSDESLLAKMARVEATLGLSSASQPLVARVAAAQRAVGLPPQGNSLRLQLDAIVAAVEGRR